MITDAWSLEPLEGLAQEALVDDARGRDRRLDEAPRVPPRGLAPDVAGHQPAVANLIGEPPTDELRAGAGVRRVEREDLVELGARHLREHGVEVMAGRLKLAPNGAGGTPPDPGTRALD